MFGSHPTTVASPSSGRVACSEAERSGSSDRRKVRTPVDDLLATVAHELRGPLNAILFALKAIGDRGDDAAVRRARAVVERQARRAARIVDDLFDVSAGALDKLSLYAETVDVAEVVTGAVQAAEHLGVGRGRRLTVSLPSAPLFVFADPVRLEQVLANLLANAAQSTDLAGHIHMTAEETAGQVVLRVRDDGRGIPPHLLPRVFDLYSQCHGPDRRHSGGLGIGLALVKSLVELHGGTVTASSAGIERGAEFVIRLPARAKTTARAERP